MKKVDVLIKDVTKQYEGLRTSLGLLLEDHDVHMFVLNHEIADMSEAYSDNLGFIEEMGGFFYSNNIENVEKHNFEYMDETVISEQIKTADLIIPF